MDSGVGPPPVKPRPFKHRRSAIADAAARLAPAKPAQLAIFFANTRQWKPVQRGGVSVYDTGGEFEALVAHQRASLDRGAALLYERALEFYRAVRKSFPNWSALAEEVGKWSPPEPPPQSLKPLLDLAAAIPHGVQWLPSLAAARGPKKKPPSTAERILLAFGGKAWVAKIEASAGVPVLLPAPEGRLVELLTPEVYDGKPHWAARALVAEVVRRSPKIVREMLRRAGAR